MQKVRNKIKTGHLYLIIKRQNFRYDFFHLQVRCKTPHKPRLHIRCKAPLKPRFNLDKIQYFLSIHFFLKIPRYPPASLGQTPYAYADIEVRNQLK
jgi:hypothetical protein